MAQYVTTHLWEQKHLLDSRRLSKARKQPIREVTGPLLIPNSFLVWKIVSLDKNREKNTMKLPVCHQPPTYSQSVSPVFLIAWTQSPESCHFIHRYLNSYLRKVTLLKTKQN
jgi:hypothetical protein